MFYSIYFIIATMRFSTWTLIVLHLVIWTSVGYGVFSYAITNKETTHLKISGLTEPDLALPVFAQFIVTQTLELKRPFLASELKIPLYLPNEPLPIKISLYQNNDLLTWWQYPLVEQELGEGKHIADLQFIVPTSLAGDIELRFDGSLIAHDLQDHAPRLFTETFDAAYPNGNYRIAQNEKKGDISLEFIEQKTKYELFIENMQNNRFGFAIQMLRWVSALLLLACLPTLIVRPFIKNS